jgi:ADP-ribose pyrophosphatase YjhB (NUDIX family)
MQKSNTIKNNNSFIYLREEELDFYINLKKNNESLLKSDKNEQNKDNFLNENPIEYITQNKPKLSEEDKKRYKNVYCVNCGEKGHVVKDCIAPITSFGIIAFKVTNSKNEEKYDKNENLEKIIKTCEKKYPTLSNNKEEYPKIKFLMIQRKDTMGYIDFIRGKYPDDENIKRKLFSIFLNEMTKQEKLNLLTKSFDELWNDLWVNHSSKTFINEYDNAKKKFTNLNLKELIKLEDLCFDFAEFGFPKGRRNMKESNIACAEREFFEETCYNKNNYKFIRNYPTIEEEFVGTNGIKYKHIYYLVKMKDKIPPPSIDKKNILQTGEVQNIGWFTFDECMSIIRPYDIAKMNVINKVYKDIVNMNNVYICSDFYYTNRKNINKL